MIVERFKTDRGFEGKKITYGNGNISYRTSSNNEFARYNASNKTLGYK